MRNLSILFLSLLSLCANAAPAVRVSSPDGRLVVQIDTVGGQLYYSATYDGLAALQPARLGIKTDVADFASQLTLTAADTAALRYDYTMRGAKASAVHKAARRLDLRVKNAKGQTMTLRFQLTDNDIAFRYQLDALPKIACATVEEELTTFRPADGATAFISPQAKAGDGWRATKPSYEEVYAADAPMTTPSEYGRGYVFPALFRVGGGSSAPAAGRESAASALWLLISETGTDGTYAACHLADYDPAAGYRIAMPYADEGHGYGSALPNMLLPAATPWRIITVGSTLAPIVETTAPYDVVEPRYAAHPGLRPGRYTWSWLIGQDESINYDEQVRFIDLAARMGYEYTLVDGWWDEKIGRERMAQLSRYAQSKGVRLLLWYNSNGVWNDAPQTPKRRMDTAAARHEEMAWLQSIGVAGIKVDFFGGDKQCTMQLYADILADANQYGLQVIFHGCTLPRGWERMFPNFAGSEAVLASENVYFNDSHARREAYDLTMHPFCRGTVAAMDWGGTIMQRFMSVDDKSRHQRHTTNVFEMAAAVVSQCSVQGILVQPRTLGKLNDVELSWLRSVPAAWDDTRLLDGYPGQYVALARRSGQRTIVAALNAADAPRRLRLAVPYAAGTPVCIIADTEQGTTARTIIVDKHQTVQTDIAAKGGVIIDNAL